MSKTVKAQTPGPLGLGRPPAPGSPRGAGVDLVPAGDLLEPHPVLGKIVFHEDPSRPLDPEDWPEE